MKNVFIVFLSLLSFSFIQSQNFSPKTGKIVFEEELIVVNPQKIDSALAHKKPMLSNMFRDILFEAMGQDGIDIDSAKVLTHVKSTIEPGLDYLLDPRKIFIAPIVHNYTFKDSIIEYQIRESSLDKNNEIKVINRATGKSSYFHLKDSIMVPDNLTLRVPIKDIDKNVKIKEFRDIRKTIFGYDCFKVVITKNESMLSGLKMLDINLSPRLKEKYEKYLEPISVQTLYVTEEIKCKYHPKVDLPQILDNYYPLEIATEDGFRSGVEKRFVLKEITIK